MNLLKLLSAGKSIVNGSKEVSYRVNKNVYLPKFDSQKNPVVTPGWKEPAEPSLEPGAAPVEKDTTMTSAKAQKSPEIYKTSRAWSKLNPSSLWNATETPSPEARAAVQCELSLDTVKVVQNDLSDADVEVVPIKSRQVPEEVAVPVLPPAEKAWEIFGERLMAIRTS